MVIGDERKDGRGIGNVECGGTDIGTIINKGLGVDDKVNPLADGQ